MKQNNTCIIIPSGHSPELLEKHLGYLQAQDTREFDVLVMGVAPNSTPPGINVIVRKEEQPIGSSGAFGLGQIAAYEMGYEYIINADIDCFPISTNAVSTLIAKAKATGKVVMPASVFDSTWDMATTNKNFIINHYATVPREIYAKYGFANFRFFKGGEDWELQCRLEMEGVLLREPSVLVEHKSFESNHIDTMSLPGSKYIYYSKNYILANMLLCSYALNNCRILTAVKYFYVTSMAFLMYWLIYHNYKDLLKAIFFDGLTFNVDARYKPRTTQIATISPFNRKCLPLSIEKGEGLVFKHGIEVKRDRIRGAFYLLKMYLKIAFSGADCVVPSKEFLDEYKFFIQYLFLLKPTQYKGKLYTENMGLLKLVGNIAFFILVYPIIAILIVLNVVYASLFLPFPVTVGNRYQNMKKFARVDRC